MAVAYNYSSVATLRSLTAAIDGSAVILAVSSGSGWPASTPFTAVIDPDTASEEIVTVTSVAGNSWTVLRAQDGSPALAHQAGAVVAHRMVGRDLRLSRQHEDSSTGVHGVTSGAVVGTTQAQTLEGKTLDGTKNTITNLSATQLTSGTVPDARLSNNVVKTTGAQTLEDKTIDGDDNTFQNIPQSAVTGLTTVAGDAASGKLISEVVITNNVECSTSPVLLLSLAFTAVSGRRYRVVFEGSVFRPTSSESIRATTTLHWKSGTGLSAYPDGTLFAQRLADTTEDNRVVPLHVERTFAPGVSGNVAVGVTGSDSGGSGIITYSAGGGNTCYLAVYDAGPAS